MTQTTFDLKEAIDLKEQGKNLVSEHGPDFLDIMREVAVAIARRKGSVTSDDLRLYATQNGIVPHNQNAWGAVFRGAKWRCDGFTRSTLVSNHARTIRRWVLA